MPLVYLMVPLADETNVEVLRAYTLWLQEQVKELASENRRIVNAKEAAKQEWLDQKLRDQLVRLQEKYYGRGKESLGKGKRKDRAVGHEGEQLELHNERPQTEKPESEKSKIPRSDRVLLHKMTPDDLAQESILRGISGGADVWSEMEGLYQESVEITTIERIHMEVVHRQSKYKLKPEYNTTGKDVIITAPGPVKVRPGTKYSVDFHLNVVSDKYEYHMPLERQRRKMQAQNLDIEVKTLYGMCEGVSEHCDRVIPRIYQNVISDFCAAHLDESPWPLLGGGGHHGYMWTLGNRKGTLFRFEPTRSGKVAEEWLRGYTGAIITDAYGGYNWAKGREGINAGLCLAHGRREFWELRSVYPVEVTQIVGLIDNVFDVEREAKSFDQLRELRKTKSKALVKQVYQWLLVHRSKHFPQSGMRQAIDYWLKNWQGLTLFLKDLRLPLSNNSAELGLRHIVMGRKNFGGSKTVDGADVAASLYTVIESAKKVGLQPTEYMKYLIECHWRGEVAKTPYERAIEILGPNERVVFPPRDQWRIE